MFSILIHLNRLKHYNIILPRETGNIWAQYTERRKTKQHNTIHGTKTNKTTQYNTRNEDKQHNTIQCKN
jgi:hypothetical protein